MFTFNVIFCYFVTILFKVGKIVHKGLTGQILEQVNFYRKLRRYPNFYKSNFFPFLSSKKHQNSIIDDFELERFYVRLKMKVILN